MSTRRKRLLLFGYLISALLVLLGVGYRAFRDAPADMISIGQGVAIKQASAADEGDLLPPLGRGRFQRRAQTIREGRPVGPVDNTAPVREQQYRELHEPLHNMKPRD